MHIILGALGSLVTIMWLLHRRIFESEFHLGKRDAAGLLISTTYLFAKGDEVRAGLDSIMAPSLKSFSNDQAASTLKLMREVADIGGEVRMQNASPETLSKPR